MRDELEDIVDMLVEACETENAIGIGETLQADINPLQQMARNYLSILQTVEPQVKEFSIIAKRQKQLRQLHGKDTVKSVTEYVLNQERMRAFLDSEIPKKLYESSFQFQMALNKYIGQEVVTTFVIDNGGSPEIWVMNSEDILNFDVSSSAKLTARYSTTVANLNAYCTKLRLENAKLKFSLPGLNATYNEVNRRYDIARAHGTTLVLWKPNREWLKMNVSARGDINEAYAMFVFLNDSNPSFTKDIENNIDDFMQLGVHEVDNESGLLKGDVTINNLEIAVKSADASTLGLTQIKNLAERIIKERLTTPEDIRRIKGELHKKARLRNRLKESCDQILEKQLIESILPK